MTTRPTAVVVEALEVGALSRFWAEALNWRLDEGDSPGRTEDDPVGTTSVGPGGPEAVELLFVPSARQKAGKNRLHLDLAGGDDLEERVRMLLGLGAVRADVGQGDVPWRVLADPEGNEFCVLPGGEWADGLAAICQDAADPAAQGRFWSAATGWTVTDEGDWGVRMRSPAGTGPALVMGPPVAPKSGRNRLRMGLRAGPGDGLAAEVARLLGAGATRPDACRAEWPPLLADPEGNEFWVLGPGAPGPAAL